MEEALQDLCSVVLVIVLKIVRAKNCIVLVRSQRMQVPCIADNVGFSHRIDVQQIVPPIGVMRRNGYGLAAAAHVQYAWPNVSHALHCCCGSSQVAKIAK